MNVVHFLHVTDTLASSLIGGLFGLMFHPVRHYFESLLTRARGIALALIRYAVACIVRNCLP